MDKTPDTAEERTLQDEVEQLIRENPELAPLLRSQAGGDPELFRQQIAEAIDEGRRAAIEGREPNTPGPMSRIAQVARNREEIRRGDDPKENAMRREEEKRETMEALTHMIFGGGALAAAAEISKSGPGDAYEMMGGARNMVISSRDVEDNISVQNTSLPAPILEREAITPSRSRKS